MTAEERALVFAFRLMRNTFIVERLRDGAPVTALGHVLGLSPSSVNRIYRHWEMFVQAGTE